jgi:hypothetical protein
VGQNGPSLCGIESLYNGFSETTKVLDIWSQINKTRVFENNEHFEFLKKKGGTLNFSVGVGLDWVQNGADYNVYTMRFLKHPKLLVYDEK